MTKRYPVKTFQRELLTFVVNQLPFFIFPPTRVRHKKQNHLIKRVKRFQDGKWEDLWNQSLHEYEIEKAHIQPLREKSIDQKVRTSQHCHQQAAISKASKALTNDAKPTSDPGHVERLQQLFPSPSADYDIPVQMGEDVPQHWPTESEINELWNTQVAFEKLLKFHSITALTKYIRSRPLLCATDIDGWRMKDLFQRIFLSSDPDNDAIKELVYDCLYLPWLKGEFMPEFAPEWAGSYLIALQKARWHSRHRTGRHLEKDHGKCYCSGYSTNGR